MEQKKLLGFLDRTVKNEIFKKFINYDLDEFKFNIDFTNIMNYQKAVNSNKHISDLFIEILKTTDFLSYRTFLDSFNKNCEHILSISKKTNTKIVLFFEPRDYKKSNFFYTCLTYMKLKELEIEFQVMSKIRDFTSLSVDNLNKYYLIVSDDVSYSGNQLGLLTISLNLEDNLHIFLNIFGYTKTAKITFGSDYDFLDSDVTPINRPDQLIIGKGAIELDFYKLKNNLLKITGSTNETALKINMSKYNLYGIKVNDKEFLNSVIKNETIFPINNLKSSILLFQKYPDDVSSYQHLCYLRHFSKYKYTFNLYNLLKQFSIELDEKLQPSMTFIDIINKIKTLVTSEDNRILTELIRILNGRYDERKITSVNDLFDNPIVEIQNSLPSTIKIISFKDGTVGVKSFNTTYNKNKNINFSKTGDFCKQISIVPFYKKENIYNWEVDFLKKKSIISGYSLQKFIKEIEDVEGGYFKKYIKYKMKYIKLKANKII